MLWGSQAIFESNAIKLYSISPEVLLFTYRSLTYPGITFHAWSQKAVLLIQSPTYSLTDACIH